MTINQATSEMLTPAEVGQAQALLAAVKQAMAEYP